MTKPLIDFVMIVKNESSMIRETVLSVKPYVDHYSILDTGSTDGTQDIIRKAFGDVPGTVYEEPFIDFATSRNRAFDLSEKSGCTFILTLNGDDTLQGGEALRKFAHSERGGVAGSYRMDIVHGNRRYDSSRLVRTEGKWRYVGVTHEVIVAPPGATKYTHTGQVPKEIVKIIHDTSKLAPGSFQRRWELDLELLGKEIETNTDPRWFFYYAQTLHCLNRLEEAYEAFTKRSKMAGFVEENYMAAFQAARCAEAAGHPWPEVQQLYLDAFAMRPHRAEPLFYIGKHYYDLGQHAKAYIFFLRASRIPYPKNDVLTIESDVYEWLIPDRLGVSAFYTNENEEGEAAVRKALAARPGNPSMMKNLELFLERKGQKTPKKQLPRSRADIVFWGGATWEPWSPDSHAKTGIGGSEICLGYLARGLAKAGHKVLVYFDGKPGTDGVYDGVEYKHYRNFTGCECKTFVSWRQPSAPHRDNVVAKKKILWMHDSHAHGQPAEALRWYDKVVLLSTWHRQTFLATYPAVSPERTVIIGNGITSSWFEKEDEGPRDNRIVFASMHTRGLDRMLKMFPEIRARVPDAELHLYYGFDTILQRAINNNETGTVEELKKLGAELETMPGVVNHGRISQEALAGELMKAKIMAFPTHIPETFCIAVAEAQAAGCVPVTTRVGALGETVKSGILQDPPADSPEYQRMFVDACCRLLENEEARKKLLNRESAREIFDWKHVIDKWSTLVGPVAKRAVVALVAPQQHVETFREVAETFVQALAENGYETTLQNAPDPSCLSIVLGANALLKPQNYGPNAIIYNLEQVFPGAPALHPGYLETLKNHHVWDYNRNNLAELAALGVRAIHVPFGYDSVLEKIPQDVQEDIDVVFYGSLNDRRRKVIDELKRRGVNVEVVQQYGPARDAKIAHAKVVLDMYYYESRRFDSVRLVYLMANKKFVVAETSSNPDIEKEFSSAVDFVPYDELADACVKALASSERATRAALGRTLIRKKTMYQSVKTALETPAPELTEQKPSRPLLEFVMIVKDEIASIRQTIASVKDNVDHWTILDTGSTDGTQAAILEAFDGVPGKLYQEPFIDYGTSRSRVLQLAGKLCVFTLMLSGDEVLHNAPILRKFCEEHRAETDGGYHMTVRIAELELVQSRLARTDQGWRYIDTVHEVLIGPRREQPEKRVQKVFVVHDRSISGKDPTVKYERYLELLHQDLEKNPNGHRTLFYLGATYKDLGRYEEAAKYYKQRVDAGGWAQERFYAALWYARCIAQLGVPWSEVQEALLDAHRIAPHRAEPLWEIAYYHKSALRDDDGKIVKEEDPTQALIYASRGWKLPYPEKDVLPVEKDIYEWKFADLMATCSWSLGNYEEGEAAARKAYLANQNDVQVIKSLNLYLKRRGEKMLPVPGEIPMPTFEYGLPLTVAVCGVVERFKNGVPKVLQKLWKQAEGKQVEIKCLLDNRMQTRAEKRNEAVANALGRFVAFVDDDDDVADDYIDQLLAAIKKDPEADVVVFEVWVSGYESIGHVPKVTRFDQSYAYSQTNEAYLRKPNHVMAWKTELARTVQYPNVRCEDTDWSEKLCASKQLRQARIDKILYYYLYNEATTTTTKESVEDVLAKRGPVKPAPPPIQERYEQLCQQVSDINEHLPVLRGLAETCQHVTEFGVRTGVSTTALLAGQPEVLKSYDIRYCPVVGELVMLRGRTDFRFETGSTLEIDIEPTNMLFIDTLHTYEQLKAELARHADKVKKCIVLHDTTTFGDVGETGAMPGLWKAVEEFVALGKFKVEKRYTNNNGLTILSRISEEN